MIVYLLEIMISNS